MMDFRDVQTVARRGSVEELSALLDKYPQMLSHRFAQYGDRYTTLLEMVVPVHDADKLALLIERGVALREDSVGDGMVHLWLATYPAYLRPARTLAALIGLGARFPSDKDSCDRLLERALASLFGDDDIELFEYLLEQGFDPVACDRHSGLALSSALSHRYGDDSTRVAERLLALGCDPRGRGGVESPISIAVSHGLFGMCRALLGHTDALPQEPRRQSNVVRALLGNGEIPLALLEDIVAAGLAIDYQRDGATLLHEACEYGNTALAEHLLRRGVDVDARGYADNTALISAAGHRQRAIVKLLIEAGAQLNAVNGSGATALDVARRQRAFKQACSALEKAGARLSLELADTSGEADGEVPYAELAVKLVQNGEPWADSLRDSLQALQGEVARHWYELCRHCFEYDSSKPSKKWRKEGERLRDQIGAEAYRERLLQLMPLVAKNRTAVPAEGGDDEEFYEHVISAGNTRMLKGLLWLCSDLDDDQTGIALRTLAAAMFKKVPWVGMRNAKLGNACVYALSVMPGDAGLKQIITLRSLTKYNPARVSIDRVFDKLASERGVTAEELEELAVPDYGMQQIGVFNCELGEYTATLQLESAGACVLSFHSGQKAQKTVPAAIKRDFADSLKEIKARQKDLKSALAAATRRLEALYLRGRVFALPDWRCQYLDHKLIGFLARRLIWRCEQGDRTRAVFWLQDRFVDAAGDDVEIDKRARISLWHPIDAAANDVLAWRNFLLERGITQPFKQAHREIYVLTDAEREAGTHSLRFANHILKHAQFHALATQRGWSQTRGGSWDGGSMNTASRELANHGIGVAFDASGIDEYGHSSGGIFECVGTGEVTFYRDGRLPLEEVDPLVFSELMRDVDLFVGVSGVGNDPDWRERNVRYWDSQFDAELSPSAQTRREVLQALIPKLVIGDKLALEERYLVVCGQLHDYRIHLGSSNILMSPNDRYLCIVPRDKGNKIMLPFEGDTTLSLILSKAFLLAADQKIADPVIVQQLMAA